MDDEKVTMQDGEQPKNEPAEETAKADEAQASEAAPHRPILELSLIHI